MRLATFLAVLPVVVAGAAQEEPGSTRSAQERRGRSIYFQGEGSGGTPIVALMGAGDVEVPASALACASCHGFDGRGRPEGGVSPSDVRWEALSKPYGSRHPSGRVHQAYDERSLRRAITTGIDPAGNPLSNVMPRYRLTHAQATDLVAFLRRVGELRDPGIESDAVRLGVLLPGAHASRAEAMASLLRACFADWNEQGGIHGRRVELVFERGGAGGEATLEALARLLEGDVLALLASSLEGAEDRAVEILEARGVPLIGAICEPTRTVDRGRYVFQLFGDLREQTSALARDAAAGPQAHAAHCAILLDPDPELEVLARQLEDARRELGAARVDVLQFEEHPRVGNAHELYLLIGPERQVEILEALDERGWRGRVLVPGPLASRSAIALAQRLGIDLRISLPRGPGASDHEGTRAFLALLRKHGLEPGEHLADQVGAWCAARLAAEVLRRAGRDLARERLIEVIEGIQGFETGVAPPLTFGPDRRVGARGGYVLRLGPQAGSGGARGAWVEASPR